ncbi:MAG: bifunctional nuclease domain-containing protein [Candidatus Latescibacterota bacterium]
MPAPSDADLVGRAQTGDAEAFGLLVDRYKNAVYGAAHARLGHSQDAQDMAQETFLQAFRRLGALRQPGRFGPWLHAIVRNLCRDQLRTRHDWLPLDEEGMVRPDDPAAEHQRRTLCRRVRRAVAGLSETLRETTVLHYLHGRTCAQIAGFLGVPEGTVKRRLSDARERLREEMIDMVQESFQPHPLPEDFRQIVVSGLQHPETDRFQLLIGEAEGAVHLLEVGRFQGQSIAVLLRRIALPRPLPYQLLQRMCHAFGLSLERAAVEPERARLVFARGRQTEVFQTEPGDAVALATCFGAPLYADPQLLAGPPVASAPGAETPMGRLWEIPVELDSPFALIDQRGGRVEQVQVLVRVVPAEEVKYPSPASRARRLSRDAGLLPVHTVALAPYRSGDNWMIWLADPAEARYLPITIGDVEGRAISAALPPERVQGEPGSGPFHDLMHQVLDRFGIAFEQVVLDRLHADVFFAFACLRRGGQRRRVDARPSDALALGLRAGAGIRVHPEVMEHAQAREAYEKWQREARKTRQEVRAERWEEQTAEHPFPLRIGTRVHFTLRCEGEFTWESRDPEVAAVTPEGEVEALREGRVTLVASHRPG